MKPPRVAVQCAKSQRSTGKSLHLGGLQEEASRSAASMALKPALMWPSSCEQLCQQQLLRAGLLSYPTASNHLGNQASLGLGEHKEVAVPSHYQIPLNMEALDTWCNPLCSHAACLTPGKWFIIVRKMHPHHRQQPPLLLTLLSAARGASPFRKALKERFNKTFNFFGHA